MTTPYNESAERFAASLIAINGLPMLTAQPWRESWFFDASSRAIFAACGVLAAEGYHITPETVLTQLERVGDAEKIGGLAAASQIIQSAYQCSPDTALYYAETLADYAARRAVLHHCSIGLPDVSQGILPTTQFATEISQLAQFRVRNQTKTLKQQLGEMLSLTEGKNKLPVIPTGIDSLDAILDGGVERGEMCVVAGETSGGKSILLAQIAGAAAQAGYGVSVFSLEMPAAAYLQRMAASLASINPRIPTSMWTKWNADKFNNAVRQMMQWNLFVEDSLSDLGEILNAARLQAANGRNVIIVDYVQRVRHTTKNGNRETEISTISRELKSLALTADAWVITASQLNEQGSLRESRAIGQDADIVLKIGEKSASIISEKHRRGERYKTINVRMRGDVSRFEEAIQ